MDARRGRTGRGFRSADSPARGDAQKTGCGAGAVVYPAAGDARGGRLESCWNGRSASQCELNRNGFVKKRPTGRSRGRFLHWLGSRGEKFSPMRSVAGQSIEYQEPGMTRILACSDIHDTVNAVRSLMAGATSNSWRCRLGPRTYARRDSVEVRSLLIFR